MVNAVSSPKPLITSRPLSSASTAGSERLAVERVSANDTKVAEWRTCCLRRLVSHQRRAPMLTSEHCWTPQGQTEGGRRQHEDSQRLGLLKSDHPDHNQSQLPRMQMKVPCIGQSAGSTVPDCQTTSAVDAVLPSFKKNI